jgi:signal transduction histidine kinase
MAARRAAVIIPGDCILVLPERQPAVAAAVDPPWILRLRDDASADLAGYRGEVSAESPTVPAAQQLAPAAPGASRVERDAPGTEPAASRPELVRTRPETVTLRPETAALRPEPAGQPAPQAVFRPPLTARLRPGRRADYAIASLFAVIIFGVMLSRVRIYRFPLSGWAASDWLPLVLAACLCIPAALRRRGPLRALVAILAVCLVSVMAGNSITRGAFLPLAFVLYLVAATSRRTVAAYGLVASLAVMAFQALALHLNGMGSGNADVAGLVLIVCWTVGYAVQQRRAYAAHLRDEAATSAVTEERLRIARELHDVVAHSMTVVAVQAGFGEYVFDSQPGEARAALGAIQTVSREALSDMQRLLGVLRHAAERDGAASDTDPAGWRLPHDRGAGVTNGGPARAGEPVRAGRSAGAREGGRGDGGARVFAPLTPAPGLADLDRLVARTAGAGVQVEVERTGRVRDMPAGIDLSAYRIVQEALTNVVKHSGADRCHVVVRYGASDLSVEITDPGTGARAAAGAGHRPASAPFAMSSGHGITGMRERVSLCGGEFSAAALPGQGFKVTAHLPLTSGAP